MSDYGNSRPVFRDAAPRDVSSQPSRSTVVVEEIERAIFAGVYTPGDRLVERELADRFRVSKTPVREALQALARRGLVVSNPYRGTRIVDIDAEMVRNLYGVRLLLEPAAMRESIGQLEDVDLLSARAALEAADEAAQADDLASVVLANRDFHQALMRRCSNDLLLGILDNLRDRVALVIVWGWGSDSRRSREAEEHERILGATERGDADAAVYALERHIESGMQSALSRLNALESPRMER
jgi:DNA-binding GntR family transcriptional regulator